MELLRRLLAMAAPVLEVEAMGSALMRALAEPGVSRVAVVVEVDLAHRPIWLVSAAQAALVMSLS